MTTTTAAPPVSLTVTAVLLLCVVVVVAVLVVYATKRHRRYSLLAPPYLKDVHLPSKTLQDKAYAQATKWLQMCTERGITTWIAGASRASFLHRHELYPWQSTITFYYVAPSPVVMFEGSHLVLKRDAMPPATISTGPYGPIPNVPYGIYGDAYRKTRIRTVSITVPRRDALDWFRYPPSMTDTFSAEVLCEV